MISGLPIAVDEAAIAAFCRDHRIVRLWFFGSVLRADFRADSDIDVLVDFEPDATLSFWDVVQIQEELADLLGRPVDLVERAALDNPFRRQQILETSRLVYAA
jgi:predicted nucleotidyltransferase